MTSVLREKPQVMTDAILGSETSDGGSRPRINFRRPVRLVRLITKKIALIRPPASFLIDRPGGAAVLTEFPAAGNGPYQVFK